MIGMNVVARNQLKPVDIARAEFEIAITGVRRFYKQHRLVDLERIERRAELLSLCILHFEGIHDDQLAIGKLRRQCRAQRTQQLLARECVVVGPRNRAMDGGAVPPEWRTDRADTRAPRALLLPQFFARTGNLPAGLGGMRAAVLPGAVMLHRLPEQVFIDRAEDFIGDMKDPDLL